jgi:hypothetical protein
MNILSWAFKIFALLPFIANGVHIVQNDLSPTGLNSKLSAAQDALDFATAGSTAPLPPEDRGIAAAIGEAASAALASTVTALHNNAVTALHNNAATQGA